MPGALQVHVGPVAAGEFLDGCDGILLGDVDGDVGTAAGCQLELVGRHVQCDDMHRILGPRTGNHAKPDRTAASDHHGVFEGDSRALDGVQRAGQRLGECRMVRRNVTGNLVHQRFCRVHHVAGHRARGAALEAVQVMGCAHVVLPALAVAAFPARHDLFGDHSVADRDGPPNPGLLVELYDSTGELVSGDHHGLGPSRAVLVAPELRRAVVALQVTGTDPDGLDPNQRLSWFALGHRDLFEPVVLGSVTDDGLHFLRNLIGHLQLPGDGIPHAPVRYQSVTRVWFESHYRTAAQLSRT